MLQLNYREYGSSGLPLIVLHGFLGSLDNWHTLATEWSRQGIHVFTIDIRNHGRSPHTDTHDIPGMVQDLLDFMQQRGLAQTSLLGHSMGGKVVMQFALDHPEKVNKLLVADMAPRSYKRGHDDVFSAIHHVDLTTMHSRKEIEDAMKPYLGDPGTRQFIMKGLERKEDNTYEWKFNFDVLERDYEKVLIETSSDKPFFGDTLFIRGGLSLYIKDQDMERIHQLFPRATLITIEHAGHWIHAEQPKAFSEALLRFL